MNLDWKKLLSTKRFRKSKTPAKGDERNDFLSDYHRVVFSSSFRRLQDKTQVSPLAANDFVRRRLTHSIEVATVGERIGRVLASRLPTRISSDSRDQVGKIVATGCLLHDIGNPPFGHEGEIAIRAWCDSKRLPYEDYCSFDGNAQSLRIAMRLSHNGEHHGLNLTHATLASFVKYPKIAGMGPRSKWPPPEKRGKLGYFASEKSLFGELWESVGLPEGQRHPLAFIVEAADDTINRLVDLEDGIKLGLIGYDTVRDAITASAENNYPVEKLVKALDSRYKMLAGKSPTPPEKRDAQQLAFQHFRSMATAAFAQAAENCFVDNIDEIESGKFTADIVKKFEYAALYEKLKTVEYANIFDDASIVRVETGGKTAIKGLLDCFWDALGTPKSKLGMQVPPSPVFPGEKKLPEKYVRAQRVIDYVAGMTDRFCIGLYQQLSGVSL